MGEILEKAIRVRRKLHKWPELSREEFETSAFIRKELEALGIEVQEGYSGTSLVALIRGAKPGATIALRADIDALPVQEISNNEYRSERQGVMHACGHDGHIAMLLGAAEAIMKDRNKLEGNVKLIFQSAEEIYGGAEVLVKEGVLDNPKVDSIYALHLWPSVPKGSIGVKEGVLMASNARFKVEVKGSSAHGAMPHLGKDALVTAAEIVGSLQNIVSRGINPTDAAVLTIGKFNSGTEYNIIPGEATLTGTVRTVSSELEEEIRGRMEAVVEGVAKAGGCTAVLDFVKQYPATINAKSAIAVARRVISKEFGENSILESLTPNMAAEDFSFYLQNTPGAMLFLGTGDKIFNKPLHHGSFDFDESVMETGIKLLYSLAMNN